MKIIPLTKFLGPLGKPDKGGFSREDAGRMGAEVKELMDMPGWDTLMDAIERCQTHEQKALMKSRATGEEATYERIIGQWAGMDRVSMVALGLIDYGKQANAEIESGKAAEAA